MSKSSARLTVILPSFQRPALLKRALESLLAQTYKDFIVCVYDNASDATTGEVVRDFMSIDSRIFYYRHSVNIGCEANFAFGLQRAKSPYVSFLSDDDILLPRCFERLMGLIESDFESAFVFGETLHVDTAGYPLAVPSTSESVTNFPALGCVEPLLKGLFPCWTGGIFRREALEAVGGIDPSTFIIDLDLILRLSHKYPCKVLHSASSIFLQHVGGSSFLPTATRFFDGYELLWDKMEKIADLKTLGMLKRHIGQIFCVKLVLAFERREFELIRSYINRAKTARRLLEGRWSRLFFAVGALGSKQRLFGQIVSLALRSRRYMKNKWIQVRAKRVAQ